MNAEAVKTMVEQLVSFFRKRMTNSKLMAIVGGGEKWYNWKDR